LAGADILVLPSRYGEGLPMSVLEAMAAGCVVVAGDVASVSSTIENGVNGFTVRPGDAEDLTETLSGILGDAAKWPAVGERATATVRERFDIAGYIARLEEIYREVAA
jgi:glycosyltransferase involved in cell wall biosynthesis